MSLVSDLICNETTAIKSYPQLTATDFAQRRAEFMQRLGKGAAIFASGPEVVRSHDTHYRYRPNSDLYYLTGFNEPETVCLLLPESSEHRFVMFVRPRNPERETWDGRRVGPEGAVSQYGADAAYNMDQLDEQLPKYLGKIDMIHYRFGFNEHIDEKIFYLLKSSRAVRQRHGVGPYGLVDSAEILHEMRLSKTDNELALMRYAANLSADAHTAAMRAVQPGMYEFEIEALIENTFRRGNALGPAYTSIVGAGANGTILHYIENKSLIKDGDLLLVDAGAEYQYYCADITRTYPANGRFTDGQRKLYEIVLAAQLAAIDKIQPGVMFDEVHQCALDIIVTGLLDLGLLTGEKETIIKEEQYKKFFMHRTSHWLGIDVHDAGKYNNGQESRRLEAGMVLTVEPGIYIGELTDVPVEYHNIGIRIEDDILVTANGREVLTACTPKDITTLESIIGRKE